MKEIAKKYGITKIVDEMDRFLVLNNEYKAHVLMIGGYSTGKSALLNKYIGKQVLKENQGPETDIATELHFSEKEHLMANMMDGTKMEISSIDDISSEEVRNIEYHLDSVNIKMQCDYVLVDTPGFDSGIEKHNKALMQYIDRGTAFILVVDCETGTISENTLKFINECTNYSTDIAVIINKCDKKIEEEIEDIKLHIKDLLEVSTGKSFSVICTSIYDEDVVKKLNEIIAGFNPEYLYEKNITAILEKKRNSLVDALEIIKNNEKCDTAEIEEEIANRKLAKKRLLEKIDLQKKRLGIKLHNEVKERIVLEIQSQLMWNIELLAEAYKGGIELFQNRVIEIIRPIMIAEIENYSSVACEDFLKNINYEILNIQDNTEEVSHVIKNVYTKLRELNKTGELLIPMEHSSSNEYSMDGGLKTYKTVSSILAIVTDIIAPPLEILIVFLPEIIKFLKSLAGNTKEQQLIEAIQNKIIPQIVDKVRNELDKSLTEIEKIMAENILANIEEILNIENNALDIAINKKNEMEITYSSFIDVIDKDILLIRKWG